MRAPLRRVREPWKQLEEVWLDARRQLIADLDREVEQIAALRDYLAEDIDLPPTERVRISGTTSPG